MKRTKILATALAIVLSMGSVAFAEAPPVIKEYTFTTQNASFADSNVSALGSGDYAEIPAEIEADGKNYAAADVSFELVSTDKPVEKTKEFTGLTEKTVPDTMKFKKEGKLTLKDTEWTEYQRSAVTGTKTYEGYAQKPDAPATKEITATLPDGTVITVTGKLQSIEKQSGGYSIPFTVDAKFTGDEDVDSYYLENVEIPNNPASPVWEGYEGAILNALGLPASEYKLTGGEWISDYQEENGQTVRYAQFSGLRSGGNWIAYYKEELTPDSPNLATYDAVATYTNGVEEATFEVKATVTYELVKKGLTTVQKIIIASAVVVVIAGLIAAILLVLGKKKKQEKEGNQ